MDLLGCALGMWVERVVRISRRASQRGPRVWLVRALYALVVVLALVLFQRGASVHAQKVNTGGKDQSAYLHLATHIHRAREVKLDGARPPAYPTLLALIRKPRQSEEQQFKEAKSHTIVWTLAAWLAFLLVLRRYLKPFTALAAWLALGFTVWMFYAPYVKAEALFYFFATTSFLLMLDVLWRPTLARAGATGLVTGIGYLFKASLSPALALFAGVQTAAALVALVQARRAPKNLRRPLLRALTVPVTIAAFLLTVSPYLVANKAKFGHYFYNVNSDFYIWYDSWGESGRGTRGHGDRKGWPEMRPSEIPSASRYFAQHGVAHALRRVERGAAGLAQGAATQYGFLPIVIVAWVSAAIALATNRALRRWVVRRWPLALFCAAYFLGYFISCTWFYAIHPGLRFLVALVPPAVIVAAWLSDRGKRRGWLPALAVFPVLVLGGLVLEAPLITHYARHLGMAGW